jgi:hypothetical protein
VAGAVPLNPPSTCRISAEHIRSALAACPTRLVVQPVHDILDEGGRPWGAFHVSNASTPCKIGLVDIDHRRAAYGAAVAFLAQVMRPGHVPACPCQHTLALPAAAARFHDTYSRSAANTTPHSTAPDPGHHPPPATPSAAGGSAAPCGHLRRQLRAVRGQHALGLALQISVLVHSWMAGHCSLLACAQEASAQWCSNSSAT